MLETCCKSGEMKEISEEIRKFQYDLLALQDRMSEEGMPKRELKGRYTPEEERDDHVEDG
jgi:hypothetical protein